MPRGRETKEEADSGKWNLPLSLFRRPYKDGRFLLKRDAVRLFALRGSAELILEELHDTVDHRLLEPGKVAVLRVLHEDELHVVVLRLQRGVELGTLKRGDDSLSAFLILSIIVVYLHTKNNTTKK